MGPTHTVVLRPIDAAVIITPSGEELHLTRDDLVAFLDATREGNDMLTDDAHELERDQGIRDAALAKAHGVEEQLEWIEAHTDWWLGPPMCTGMPTEDEPIIGTDREAPNEALLDPIDTPAVHAQLRDVLDSMFEVL
jgi:hypothetical protein